MTDIQTRAFISHSHKDQAEVLALKGELIGYGIECWCFEEDLPFSKSIEEEVKREIADSDFMVIFLSESSLKSKWIQWELGYRQELIDIRGVDRPHLMPVQNFFDISDNILSLEVQPLRMGTDHPIGRPIDFAAMRAHHFQDSQTLPLLAKNMLPEFCVIRQPEGRDRTLFAQVCALWQQTYPAEEFPPEEDIVDWIETDSQTGNTDIWPEIVVATHYQNDLFGFANLTVHKDCAYAFISYWGINHHWADGNKIKLFFSMIERLVKKTFSFVEVLIVELAYDQRLSDSLKSDNLEERDIAECLGQIRLFNKLQNANFKVLTDGAGAIIPFWNPDVQPPLRPPVTRSIILARSLGEEGIPFREDLVSWYYDRTLSGYGPKGLNIPDYETYIADLVKMQMKQFRGVEGRYERVYLSARLRRLLK
jgi:TIR domain